MLLALFSAQVSVAATITVDDTNCTLSNAITSANNDSAPSGSQCTAGSGADTIILGTNWSSPKTLSQALPNISSDITIEGNIKELDGNNNYRIFHVETGAKLTLKNLALTNGSAGGSTGGALYINIHGQARLEGVTVTNSSADNGGGIFANGSLTLINSIIKNNGATTGGGGLHIGAVGSATIQGSEFSNNSAGSGGGMYAQGPLTVINSTLLGNRATGSEGGGGIYVKSSSTTITHATLYGNSKGSASNNGADILVKGGRLSLRNSILADDNASDNDDNCSVDAPGGTLSQNVGNVIQHGSGGCTSSKTNASTDTGTGSPLYITLNSDSDAIGLGAAEYCKSTQVDQRGLYRPKTSCDAGAVEMDGFNYIYVDSGCTLSQAIQNANDDAQTNSGCEAGVGSDTATDTIHLTANITLSAQAQSIDSKMIVEGNGRTITASGSVGLLAIGSNGNLTMRDITLTGANKDSGGGAISVLGTLDLSNCILRDNHTSTDTGGGGAIEFVAASGGGTIDRCAFISNSSDNYSGAIGLSLGTVTISNSTFYKNHSRYAGGAMRLGGGTTTLSHLTVWDNTTDSNAAVTGIQTGGTSSIHNSIIGRSTTQGGALCGGTFQNSTTERGIITFNGPQTDSCGTVTVANPLLGGLTGAIPYLPLGAGSPAIGKGIAAQCANYPVDQASRARPATNCDIGAVQYLPQPASADASDGASDYVAPGRASAPEPPVCTGEALNETGVFKVSTTYGLCNGVQFNPLELSAIGIGYVIEAGPLAAVDVWGWVTSHVELCYRSRVSMLFLDASTSPRTVAQLASVWDGEWTCAQISRAGTIVLMPADSYLTTPPVDAAAPERPPATTPLANCMARLDYILNFRATPGGAVMMHLPYGVKLTAFQRTADWVEVDWYGQRGWVSASHVTFEGAC